MVDPWGLRSLRSSSEEDPGLASPEVKDRVRSAVGGRARPRAHGPSTCALRRPLQARGDELTIRKPTCVD